MPNRGFEVAARRGRTRATESPNGELGFYLVGDGSDAAYRARDAAAVVHPLRGVPAPDPRPPLSDVVAVLGSLNIIAAELDR